MEVIRKGKERKGKERKGKERKGKERKINLFFLSPKPSMNYQKPTDHIEEEDVQR